MTSRWRHADAAAQQEARVVAHVLHAWLDQLGAARARCASAVCAQSATCERRAAARAALQRAIERGLAKASRQQPRNEAHGDDDDDDDDNDDESSSARGAAGEMPLVDAARAAATIEDVLFWRWYYAQPGVYAHKCRMLEHNMERNAWRLLTRYGPETVCVVPASELCAGTPLAAWRAEHRRRVVADLKPPTPRSSTRELGIFRCPKCGGRHTTHYSMQTRSADEPMTNFVSCLDCLIRFKR